MKNTRKYKILALVALCLAAILCFCACGSSTPKASDTNGKAGDLTWKYTSSDKTLSVSGTGKIPAYSLTSDSPWYSIGDSVEVVKIESGVSEIGDYAFYGFSNLKSVSVPSSVSVVGKSAFAYCSSLESIVLPASLTSVGESAFEACLALKSIDLGESLTSLGARAFAFCSSLKTVTLLSENVEVKSETFMNCYALEKLLLHTTITEDKVADDAFANITFSFDKAQHAESSEQMFKITINYLYEDGTKAAEPVELSVKIGEAYAKNSPEIKDYKADKLTVEGNATEDMSVTVTYKKVAAETEAADQTTNAPEDEKDGDNGTNFVALIIMVVVIVGIGVGAFLLVRAEKKTEHQRANQNKAKNRKQ